MKKQSKETTFLAIYPALAKLTCASENMLFALGQFKTFSSEFSSDPNMWEIFRHPARPPVYPRWVQKMNWRMKGRLTESIKTDSWFEPEATQLHQALDDPMLQHFPDEHDYLLKEGLSLVAEACSQDNPNILTRPLGEGLSLVAEACNHDDPNVLTRAEHRLELGSEQADGITSDLAWKVFGRWGMHFFYSCVHNLPDDDFDPEGFSPEFFAELLAIPRTPANMKVFVPNAFQKRILQALDGRALNKQQLAVQVCGGEENGNLLYRPERIKELRKHGLVDHKRGVGFYRPNAPPPNTQFVRY